MNARSVAPTPQPWLDAPDHTVFVFLDECYEPRVAAAAVVLEAAAVERLNTAIASAVEHLKNSYYLDGHRGFDEFRNNGFHATSDPVEVSNTFVALLASELSFKTMIAYSEGVMRPELSEKRRLMVVFDRLVRDVFRAYRGRPKITFYFESAQAMDPFVERLVMRALAAIGHPRPMVEVRFGTKRSPDILAVPDYVLHIFNAWLTSQKGPSQGLDPRDHQSRTFKAILGSVSAARSIDSAHVVRRTLS